jgi:hypothetical protein
VRRLILTAIALCAFLAGWVSHFGGIDFRIGDVVLRSHDPIRPLAIAIVLLLVYGIAFRDAFIEQAHRLERLMERHAVWVAVICSVIVAGLAVRWSTYAASGSDSSGYVSEAYGWRYGPLPRPIPLDASLPWPSPATALAPLGYAPAPDSNAIVPTYSPGLPMMMALLLAVVGPRGPYLVVPVFAGLIVWTTFVLGRRIGGPGAAALGALFVCVSPIVLFQSLWPMTDVPIGALWTGAAAAALGGSRRRVVLTGVIAACAVLVRPNLPLVPAAFVLHFLLDGPTRREGLIRAATFSACVAPAVLCVAILNARWYGGPFHSGYGTAATLYSLSSIWPNLQRYPVWLVRSHSMLSVLFLLPLVMWKRMRASQPGIRLAYLLIAATWLSYLPYFAFDEWWYLRFLLPAIPAMLILAAMATLALGRLAPPRWSGVLTFLLAAALFVGELRFTRSQQMFGPLYLAEQRYVTVGLYLRRVLPDNGIVLAIQHSGSARFYTGRPIVRFDLMDQSWAPRAQMALISAGYHPFAVFEDYEMPQLRALLGLDRNTPLPWRLIARLDQPIGVTIYDLAPASDPRPPVALSIGDGHRAVRGGGY